MKKLWVFLVLMMFLALPMAANAALTTIGTANLSGDSTDYNLIYDDAQNLVWLDYTKSADTWANQGTWASALGGNITAVNLDPGYTSTINWSTGWRLPSAGNNPQSGVNQTSSEIGYLYYEVLGNIGYDEPGWNNNNTENFSNLRPLDYWLNTEYSSTRAWHFNFHYGYQGTQSKDYDGYNALAVHPVETGELGEVETPIPGAIWLLGSGLVGLLGFRRKFRRE